MSPSFSLSFLIFFWSLFRRELISSPSFTRGICLDSPPPWFCWSDCCCCFFLVFVVCFCFFLLFSALFLFKMLFRCTLPPPFITIFFLVSFLLFGSVVFISEGRRINDASRRSIFNREGAGVAGVARALQLLLRRPQRVSFPGSLRQRCSAFNVRSSIQVNSIYIPACFCHRFLLLLLLLLLFLLP